MNVVPFGLALCILAVADGFYLRHDSGARTELYPQQLTTLLAATRASVRHRRQANIMELSSSSTTPFLKSIESTLLAMAKNASQASQDFMSRVQADVMGTITEELKPQILAEHGLIQSQVAQFTGFFERCEMQREAGLNTSTHWQESIPGLIVDHRTCRIQEGTFMLKLKICREKLESFKHVDASTCQQTAQLPDAASCASLNGETAEAYHRRMLAHFETGLQNIKTQKMICANNSQALQLQEAACTGQEQELQQTTSKCVTKQNTLDSAVCDLGGSMNTTCAGYRACRSQANDSYKLVRHTVKSRETTLHEEWRALQRIECILHALTMADIVSAAQDCANAVHSVAHLLVNYVTVPSLSACEILAEVPGTPEYAAAVFKGMPADVPLAACSAACCV
ncbi:unnamed protein product [Effrenium voratum]|uniref:Uncharacterized protein n=1 Tax=Effrenium voratum TaxID=2562239 RepID=A0AA36JM17_9DINO|nr:unnamed protein product [Effrenium voratum]CAJ1427940.1 unnamed protein product [Effrenium voratum]